MKAGGFAVVMAMSVCALTAADIRVVEEIAAKVNGDIITRGELDQARKDIEQQLRAEGLTGARLADAVRQYAANALRDQIDQLLLVQKGKDLNIKVDPDVNRRLADLQLQSKLVDPDKFHEWIRQGTGMTYEDYKDKLTRQLLSQRVIGQEVTYRVNIPEADLRKYYEEHKTEFVRKAQVFLSQILISTEGKNPDQVAAAEKKAKDITARARKGEKFTDLVRDNSDDPETARNGGELPPREPGMSLPQIEETVFKERKGYITEPIKIPTGFVIFRINERYEAGQASFEEVKNDIQERMAGPKVEPKIREYLTMLREQAFLEIKEGYVDSGAAPNKDTAWKDVAQLKPQTTTKEEVAAHSYKRKRLLVMPIPGTKKFPTVAAEPDSDASPAAGAEPAAPAANPPATSPRK
jgi:peptidyl-prolyl cis-trans isomerase SurA